MTQSFKPLPLSEWSAKIVPLFVYPKKSSKFLKFRIIGRKPKQVLIAQTFTLESYSYLVHCSNKRSSQTPIELHDPCLCFTSMFYTEQLCYCLSPGRCYSLSKKKTGFGTTQRYQGGFFHCRYCIWRCAAGYRLRNQTDL
jgi:hypothetical protein